MIPAFYGKGAMAGLTTTATTLLALAACYAVPDTPTHADPSTNAVPDTLAATVPAGAAHHDSVATWLEVPDTVARGEPVPITIHVMNVTAEPVVAHLSGTVTGGERFLTFDVTIRDTSGALVWRRTHFRPPLGMATRVPIAPGDTLRIHDTWDQHRQEDFTRRGERRVRVEPGTYVVIGHPQGNDRRVWRTPEARVTIR